MIALVALMIAQGQGQGRIPASQIPAMPQAYVGVYASRTGQVFILNSTHSVQAYLNGRHLTAWKIQEVPNYTFLGVWRATRDLVPGPGNDTEYASAYSTGARVKSYVLPMPSPSRIESEYGEVRLSTGLVTANGTMQSLNLQITDANRAVKFSEPIYPACTIDSIDVAGTFNGSKCSVSLRDGNGRIGYFDGTLILRGTSYIVKGYRGEGRGQFSLGDAATDRIVGQGFIEYMPSPDYVRKLQSGQAQGTDQLMLGVQLTGAAHFEEMMVKR